jgi:hypothetical protein
MFCVFCEKNIIYYVLHVLVHQAKFRSSTSEHHLHVLLHQANFDRSTSEHHLHVLLHQSNFDRSTSEHHLLCFTCFIASSQFRS